MKWFNIIKEDNPHSLYSLVDISEMIKEITNHEKLYGYSPVKYYGNTTPLNNLRADYLTYFDKRWYSDPRRNYFIKEIKFDLEIDFSPEKIPYVYIWVEVISYNIEYHDEDITPTYRADSKVAADFVEIYNEPNHKYKNLVANLDGWDKEALKGMIERWKDEIPVFKILKGLKL